MLTRNPNFHDYSWQLCAPSYLLSHNCGTSVIASLKGRRQNKLAVWFISLNSKSGAFSDTAAKNRSNWPQTSRGLSLEKTFLSVALWIFQRAHPATLKYSQGHCEDFYFANTHSRLCIIFMTFSLHSGPRCNVSRKYLELVCLIGYLNGQTNKPSCKLYGSQMETTGVDFKKWVQQ